MNKKHDNIFKRLYHKSVLNRFLVFYVHPMRLKRIYKQKYLTTNPIPIYIYQTHYLKRKQVSVID